MHRGRGTGLSSELSGLFFASISRRALGCGGFLTYKMADHLLCRIFTAVAATLLALTVPAIGASAAETRIELARAELMLVAGDREFNALAGVLLARRLMLFHWRASRLRRFA